MKKRWNSTKTNGIIYLKLICSTKGMKNLNSYPNIEVNFIIEGTDLNLDIFTKKINIMPTKTRDIDHWPKAIKNNVNLPKEMQPRFVWCICEREEEYKKVETPIKQILSKLEGKEQILNDFCEKNDLKKALTIVIMQKLLDYLKLFFLLKFYPILGI